MAEWISVYGTRIDHQRIQPQRIYEIYWVAQSIGIDVLMRLLAAIFALRNITGVDDVPNISAIRPYLVILEVFFIPH